MKKISKILILSLALLVFGTACAQDSGNDGAKENGDSDYPNKPVEVVVAFGAGGETDMIARLLFDHAEKYFGQKFAVINKPGASGEIGWTEVSNAKPDGYTLAFINPPTFVTHPIQNEATQYKIEDFEIIANMVKDPACIIVGADSDIENVDELYERARDGDISIGYSGPGTSEALTLQQLDALKEIELEKIPYDGSAPSIVALLGGHIDAAILNISGAFQHTGDGSVKVIGVAGHERDGNFPDVTTFEEVGLPVYNEAYRGLAAPAGVSDDVIAKIEEAIKKTLEDEEFLKKAEELNIPLYYLNSAEYTKVIHELHDEIEEENKKTDW